MVECEKCKHDVMVPVKSWRLTSKERKGRNAVYVYFYRCPYCGHSFRVYICKPVQPEPSP